MAKGKKNLKLHRTEATKPSTSKYAAKVERRRKLAHDIGTTVVPLPVLVNGEEKPPADVPVGFIDFGHDEEEG